MYFSRMDVKNISEKCCMIKAFVCRTKEKYNKMQRIIYDCVTDFKDFQEIFERT
jgi:DNA polymerase II small subunit/DNA polymerase delta subunit B